MNRKLSPWKLSIPCWLIAKQFPALGSRKLISAGQVDEANRLLTGPYRIRGMVRHAPRGSENWLSHCQRRCRRYATTRRWCLCRLHHHAGRVWPAAINIGPNPTFGEQTLKVEVHLIGFNDSLYGQPLEVDFLARLRNIVQFPGVDALKAQFARDVTAAKENTSV